MSLPRHVSSEELARHMEGEVTLSRAREIQQALTEDPVTAQRDQQLRAMVRAVAEPDEAIASMDLVQDVRALIQAEQAAPRRRFSVIHLFTAGGLALAAAASVMLWTVPPEGDGFASKGGGASGWAGLQVFRERGAGAALPLSGEMCPSDALMFAVTGGMHAYLMVFAVDSTGEVFWYFPAYTDAAADPQSIPLAGGAVRRELPEKVRHKMALGPAVIYGMFTPQPLTVKTVEGTIAQLKAVGGWDGAQVPMLPLEGAVQHRVPVVVTPCP